MNTTLARKQVYPPGLLSKPNCQPIQKLAKTGNFYEFVRDMGKEFGEVSSLAPGLYIYASSQTIKEIFRNTKDFRKPDPGLGVFKILAGEGLFTADGEIYDQQERAVKSAFGKKYFGEFRKIMEEEIERFIDQPCAAAKGKNETVNVTDLSVDLTMSIAARSFFGIGGETALARKFRKGLVFVQDWFARLQAADFAGAIIECVEKQYVLLPILESLQKSIFRGLSGSGKMIKTVSEWKRFVEDNDKLARDTAAEMRGICAQIIERRRKEARFENKNDVLTSLLLLQKDPENKWLTDERIIDQVATFFVAGHETTSDLFCTLLWKHARGETPEAVKEELRNAGDMINEEQFLFQKYPATYAYLSEVLVEHPPVVFSARQAKNDVEVGGYFLPKGTRIILSINSAQDIDVNFGFGRRQCIGRVFALEEAVIGLQHLIRYKLELKDPAQKLEITEGLTIGYSRSPVPILAKSV